MIEDIKIREQNRAARFKLRSTLIQELSAKLGPYVQPELPTSLYSGNTKKSFHNTLIVYFRERETLLLTTLLNWNDLFAERKHHLDRQQHDSLQQQQAWI
jgi:hypothetical protein